MATDELYKTLEESAKLATDADSVKSMENENRTEGPTESTGSAMKSLEFSLLYPNESVKEEDEWSEFTEENRMELMSLGHSSGSTILTQLAVGEVKAQDSEQTDTGGDGMNVGQKHDDDIGNTTCPWVKMEHALEQQKLKEPMSVEQPNKKEPSEVKSQIYIPPALRQSQGDFNRRDQAESRLRKVPSKMSGKPQAPDLNSDEYFPSLSKTLKRTK